MCLVKGCPDRSISYGRSKRKLDLCPKHSNIKGFEDSECLIDENGLCELDEQYPKIDSIDSAKPQIKLVLKLNNKKNGKKKSQNSSIDETNIKKDEKKPRVNKQ